MPAVSVVILTHNEEANIGDCLASAAGLDDVHVLDSGSTDRTAEIAGAAGASVHVNPFHGFGQQRNWAIDHIPARHEWQFHLDADERLTPPLVAEMSATLGMQPAVGGYLVPSKQIFAGRWLRHAGQYPGYQVRLFHKGRLRFVDHGHGQREQTDYPLGQLKEPYLHHAFSKGLDHWFAKHAVYARQEAEQSMGLGSSANGQVGGDGSLFSADPVRRRRALKRISSRLPARYFLRLAYMLFVKGAFLDGRAGIAYAHMLATY
ncbi:MAG TPA: glycosyltransferase family 2 protein, partial [Gemmataceae bacterium]|nr:glycosyltransferase family 2 protein [Gemmataceae bacterium]